MITADMIMTKKVMGLRQDESLQKAMKIIVGKKISGLPVVDDENKVVGVITEKDLLKLLAHQEIDKFSMVDEHMSKSVIAFDVKADVVDICELFIKKPIRRVPILKDGKLAGIISRRDIIKLIMGM